MTADVAPAPVPDQPSAVRRRLANVQLGVTLWLTVLWLVLWRDLTFPLVVGGLLVGVVVQLVFPLPPLRMHLRPRPVGLLVLVAVFLRDVVVASWQVTRIVLRPGPVTNAVVEIQLRTPSDFVLTIVGEMLTLIPGSVLVEARRASHTIYMHVLDVADEDDVEEFRQLALAQERRVLRAFGIDDSHLSLPPEQAQQAVRDRAAGEDVQGVVHGVHDEEGFG
ncbi:Na+/H+ antiporter subunit E [Nocardioides sp. J54]|uniref:Na+/H+ antiporter subunit E n=1 Tax=Nocardioides sp. J54 TaxID=935866 RepID=UPI0004BA73A5|nr:Na+/H+ antiporter subunit E [Nocardioides sp. J54]